MQRCAILAAVVVFLFAWFALTAHAQVIFPARGGTGTSTIPTLGQLLVGQANGSYAPQATSTLGISTTDITEGLKLFYTDARVGSYITASSTPLSALLNYWTKSGTDLSYSSGNVGIGTTGPGAKLDVRGATALSGAFIATPVMRVYSTNAAAVNTGGIIALGGETGNATTPFAFGFIRGAKESVGVDNYAGYLAFNTVAGSGTAESNSGDYERLRITSTGNVGIGDTTPDAKLDLLQGSDTSAQGLQISRSNDSDYTRMYKSAGIGTLSDPLIFNTNFAGDVAAIGREGSAYFAGNVGIGQSSPIAALDLGNGTGGRGIAWSSSGTGNYANIYTPFSASGIVLATGFRGSTSADTYLSSYGSVMRRSGVRLNAFNDDGIQFFADTAATIAENAAYTPTERMRITPSGNVGIGTTNPFSLLTVGGSQAGNAGFEIVPGSGIVIQGYNRTAGAYTSINFDGSSIGFRPNGAFKLFVNPTGVGIGTTSPAHALDLFSTATTTMRVDSSSITQGSCLALKDSDGVGYTYVTANNGVLSASVTPCS